MTHPLGYYSNHGPDTPTINALMRQYGSCLENLTYPAACLTHTAFSILDCPGVAEEHKFEVPQEFAAMLHQLSKDGLCAVANAILYQIQYGKSDETSTLTEEALAALLADDNLEFEVDEDLLAALTAE